MCIWIEMGPKWNSEMTYRVIELLKENGIALRMPSDEMFFQSIFHLPRLDRIWGIQVKRKDWSRAVSLLGKEGLLFSPVQRPATVRSGKYNNAERR